MNVNTGINELDHIVGATLLDGGGTFSLSALVVPTAGYVVGILGNRIVPERKLGLSVSDFIYDYALWLLDARSKCFLGTWVEGIAGEPESTVTLDVVRVTDNLEHAAHIAAIGGERAIYNLGTGETIYV